MRFALGVPNVGSFGNPRALVDLAVTAEAAGWDAFFLWDHLLYRDPAWPVVDPIVVMSAVAARTERIQLGLMVLALPRRRPEQTAKELATLDQLSGGRLVVGAGLGSLPREYDAFGASADPRERADLLDESLEVITGLWSGQPVSFHGQRLTVDDVQMLPTPAQRPRPRLWCGGRWPARRPFRRAARYDGVMPTHEDFGAGTTMPPETLSEIVRYVSAHRETGDPFDVAIEGSTLGATDAGRASDYAAAGATWWVEALGWWRGDIDEARARTTSGPPVG
ncbi:MAG TPA: TIGR03619 family F420-dependent LLM class oxidoreductase [Mycobacteriales bacterium]|nr:TIGR03619 family F420-dependent LLM class oxidoreductase [Mycobacteriales bacterium]